MQYIGGKVEAQTSCLGLMLLGAVERRGAVGWDVISCSTLELGDEGLYWAFSFTCRLNATDFIIIGQSKPDWYVENN